MNKLLLISLLVISTNSLLSQINCSPKCEPDCCDLTVTPTQGTAPFTYEWSTTETTQTITACESQTFTVTVTDANGCEETLGFETEINETPQPLCQSWVRDENNANFMWIDQSTTPPCTDIPACCGWDVRLFGDIGLPTGSYTWLWSSGQTTSRITLSNIDCSTFTFPSAFSVTVTDTDTGCTGEISYNIVQGNNCCQNLMPTATCTPTTCHPNNDNYSDDGTASVDVGTSWLWDDAAGSTTQSISGLPAGTYTVTVTDSSGCTSTAQCAVNNGEEIILSGVCN